MDLKREQRNLMVILIILLANYYFYTLSNCPVDSGASNHTVSVLSADGQLNQQANVIYTTYPGAQITQYQLG